MIVDFAAGWGMTQSVALLATVYYPAARRCLLNLFAEFIAGLNPCVLPQVRLHVFPDAIPLVSSTPVSAMPYMRAGRRR
ncbi:hypothetical protein D3C81_1686920 [compost metagenome]